jgi:hypothetical protein
MTAAPLRGTAFRDPAATPFKPSEYFALQRDMRFPAPLRTTESGLSLWHGKSSAPSYNATKRAANHQTFLPQGRAACFAGV